MSEAEEREQKNDRKGIKRKLYLLQKQLRKRFNVYLLLQECFEKFMLHVVMNVLYVTLIILFDCNAFSHNS